jgi:ribosomal protein L7/L12
MDPDVRDALERLTQRIRVIEANIGVLAEQAGLQVEQPESSSVPQDVIDLAVSGNKIGAIKRYRQYVPSASLEEAKSIVDAI